MTTKTIRAFYAIKLNDETKATTQQVIGKLQSLDWNQYVRWVPVSNLHITLRFLGNVTESQLEQMNIALTEKLDNVSPFSIRFKEPRLFPHFRKPKVVAILVPHNDSLNQLAKLFEQCAQTARLQKGHIWSAPYCKKKIRCLTKRIMHPYIRPWDEV